MIALGKILSKKLVSRGIHNRSLADSLLDIVMQPYSKLCQGDVCIS